MSADVAAALALSRAALNAVATASPAHCAAVELALEEELDRAHELSAVRTVEVLEDVRSHLQGLPEQMALMAMLEQALVAAAEALPEGLEPADAEEALLRRQ
jgi:hypothetical protein